MSSSHRTHRRTWSIVFVQLLNEGLPDTRFLSDFTSYRVSARSREVARRAADRRGGQLFPSPCGSTDARRRPARKPVKETRPPRGCGTPCRGDRIQAASLLSCVGSRQSHVGAVLERGGDGAISAQALPHRGRLFLQCGAFATAGDGIIVVGSIAREGRYD